MATEIQLHTPTYL